MKSFSHLAVSESKYLSPVVIVRTIQVEGVLCASGSHDPFSEDDSWVELLEND